MQTLSRADARINWWHSLEYGQYSMITSVQRDPKYETLSTSWNSCKPEMISIKTLFTVVWFTALLTISFKIINDKPEVRPGYLYSVYWVGTQSLHLVQHLTEKCLPLMASLFFLSEGVKWSSIYQADPVRWLSLGALFRLWK